MKATPHSPKGDVLYVRALEQTVRSGAHGFRSRRPRLRATILNFVGFGLTEQKFRQNPIELFGLFDLGFVGGVFEAMDFRAGNNFVKLRIPIFLV